MKKLTIGSAAFDDFEGVYFTYQSLRLANIDRLDELDLVLIDNNPSSPEGRATEDFCSKAGIRYFPEPIPRSTAIRDRVFRVAEAPFTLCIDSHVLFEPETISHCLDFAEGEGSESSDLFHGAMLYDYLGEENPATHLDPVWRDNMFGIWGHDERALDKEGEPFEIPSQGLGLFGCRTEAWAGFSPLFQGFGGEEGYIHEKFRQRGDKVWCLPWLRWVHRFARPRGNTYPLNIEERIRNYTFGWLELGKELEEIREHFEELHPRVPVSKIMEDAEEIFRRWEEEPQIAIELIHGEKEKERSGLHQRAEKKGVEVWNDTEIRFGSPLEIEILEKLLRIERLSLKWSVR
tara:strand:+ start:1308 stop:2348 length:1041 start_codon:yes stop_codon:yes gene_type:complete